MSLSNVFHVHRFTGQITQLVGCRKAWIALGELTRVDSQVEIVKLLEGVDSHMREIVLERWRAKQAGEDKEETR